MGTKHGIFAASFAACGRTRDTQLACRNNWHAAAADRLFGGLNSLDNRAMPCHCSTSFDVSTAPFLGSVPGLSPMRTHCLTFLDRISRTLSSPLLALAPTCRTLSSFSVSLFADGHPIDRCQCLLSCRKHSRSDVVVARHSPCSSSYSISSIHHVCDACLTAVSSSISELSSMTSPSLHSCSSCHRATDSSTQISRVYLL